MSTSLEPQLREAAQVPDYNGDPSDYSVFDVITEADELRGLIRRVLKWNPMVEAPVDGTPVLTDEGICKAVHRSNGQLRWLACDPAGGVFRCADEGPFECSPTCWKPLPEVTK